MQKLDIENNFLAIADEISLRVKVLNIDLGRLQEVSFDIKILQKCSQIQILCKSPFQFTKFYRLRC